MTLEKQSPFTLSILTPFRKEMELLRVISFQQYVAIHSATMQHPSWFFLQHEQCQILSATSQASEVFHFSQVLFLRIPVTSGHLTGKPQWNKNREEQDCNIPQTSLRTKSWNLKESTKYRNKDSLVSNYSCSYITSKNMKDRIHRWHRHNAFSSNGKTSHSVLLLQSIQKNRSKDETCCSPLAIT